MTTWKRVALFAQALWWCLRDRDMRAWMFARDRWHEGWKARLRAVWCRGTGHRGVVWYNIGGDAPDMTCKGCGDDLG